MDTLNTPFGWTFIIVAAIFTLGLMPRFARRFYPTAPRFLVRLAAPVIFALLATACFLGLALKALSIVVILGMAQIIVSQWRGRKQPPLA